MNIIRSKGTSLPGSLHSSAISTENPSEWAEHNGKDHFTPKRWRKGSEVTVYRFQEREEGYMGHSIAVSVHQLYRWVV